MNMDFKFKLPIPMEIKKQFPLSKEAEQIKAKRDEELKAIFEGKERKLVLIVGPCSADNEDSVMDYISRLVPVQEKVKDKIFIVPRIYTNKPRTTGDGYKGLVHQPDPNGDADLIGGIIAMRKLHMRAVNETGFICADEMLYPDNYRYLSDILGYVAIGARSVENQEHRLVSSGLTIPVGMKNPTGGDLSVMMNSVTAAQHEHDFIYRGWQVHSFGNPLSHTILRGYVNKHGQSLPNYHYEDLNRLCELYAERPDLKNPAVVVDTNHANSAKQYEQQIRISKEILHSCRHNKDVDAIFKGLMIESYIEDGCQKIGGGVYGKSITDPCLGFEKTEKLIYELAEMY